MEGGANVLAPRLLPVRREFIVVAGNGILAYAPIQAGFLSTVTDGERGQGFAAQVLVLARGGGFFVRKPDRASDRWLGHGEGEGGEAGADGMRGAVEEKGSHDREADAG